MRKNVVLTGRPGIGKSTLIRKIIHSLEPDEVDGFWSAEIREMKVNDTLTFKCGWLVEISQVETVDAYGNLKSEFMRGEKTYFNMTIENIAFSSKTAALAVVVYDERDVPIGHVLLDNWSVSPGTIEVFIVGVQIPEWAYVGLGTVYANAFTDLPQLYGTPYCPEVSTTLTITKP